MMRLNTELDILDAALMEYLPRVAQGCTINRQNANSALVILNLNHTEMGSLGEIRLRKITNNQADLVFTSPPYPNVIETTILDSSRFMQWIIQHKSMTEIENFKQHKEQWYSEFFRQGEGWKDVEPFWALEFQKWATEKSGSEPTLETLTKDFLAYSAKVLYQRRLDYKQFLIHSLLEQLRKDGIDTPEDGRSIRSAGESGQTINDDNRWKAVVKNIGNDQAIIELWRKDYQAREIAQRVGRGPKTITKKITELRKLYGPEIVPYRKK